MKIHGASILLLLTGQSFTHADMLERARNLARRMQLEPISDNDAVMTEAQEAGRTIARFTKGNPENEKCWDRSSDGDGYISVVDIHNHAYPFEGPNVPFENYFDWMEEHGIVFTVFMGLGQRIIKTNAEDPDCCYYLHCPTFNYTVTPSDMSDRLNADWFTSVYMSDDNDYSDRIKIFLSATFPDLQTPENNTAILDDLEATYPGAFSWTGEFNLVKHALAANGFFNKPTVTESDLAAGTPLHEYFTRVAASGWPATIHSDMGCDNFLGVPGWEDRCVVEDPDAAAADFQWWKDFLGVHYGAFFNQTTNTPLENFRKIQYVKLFDTLLTTFPDLKVTWAHMGLSKELLRLHPVVHNIIMKNLFDAHPNLYADISWDIIAQLYLMNHAGMGIEELEDEAHEDITMESEVTFNSSYVVELREILHGMWLEHQPHVQQFGTVSVIDGPTHSMAAYYDLIHEYSDRFLTGTDFVSSLGEAEDWPGLAEFKFPPTGCMKNKPNHARQLTDTSTINMLLDDDAFRKIVLGENFFRISGTSDIYQPPPICQQSTEAPTEGETEAPTEDETEAPTEDETQGGDEDEKDEEEEEKDGGKDDGKDAGKDGKSSASCITMHLFVSTACALAAYFVI